MGHPRFRIQPRGRATHPNLTIEPKAQLPPEDERPRPSNPSSDGAPSNFFGKHRLRFRLGGPPSATITEVHMDTHVDLTVLPEWAIQPFRVCLQKLQNEGRFLHLALCGFRGLSTLTTLVEIVGPSKHRNTEDHQSWLQSAKVDAEWVKSEEERGFPLLHAHSVVALWGDLEVLANDVSIAWLQHAAKAWENSEIAKVKIAINMFQQLSPNERARFVISELSRTVGLDQRKGVGKLKATLGVFGLAPEIGTNCQRAIHELCQVRNVVVHCGGIVDQKLMNECPWLDAEVGGEIPVSHLLWSWYSNAVLKYVERALNRMAIKLGFPGCACPDADDISERPGLASSAAGEEGKEAAQPVAESPSTPGT